MENLDHKETKRVVIQEPSVADIATPPAAVTAPPAVDSIARDEAAAAANCCCACGNEKCRADCRRFCFCCVKSWSCLLNCCEGFFSRFYGAKAK